MSRRRFDVSTVRVGQRYRRDERIIEVETVPRSTFAPIACRVRNVVTDRRTHVTRESLCRYYTLLPDAGDTSAANANG